MPTEKDLLESIQEMSAQEFALLEQERIDEALQLARTRSATISSLVEQDQEKSSNNLADKLLRLQKLQGRLTSKAEELKGSISKDMKRLSKKPTQPTPYTKRSNVTPLTSKYIHKVG